MTLYKFIEAIEGNVQGARQFGASGVLSGTDRSWERSRHRALVGYVLIRQLGYKLKDVARYLGRDIAAVSSLISRHAERIVGDEGLKKQAARIAKHCLE